MKNGYLRTPDSTAGANAYQPVKIDKVTLPEYLSFGIYPAKVTGGPGLILGEIGPDNDSLEPSLMILRLKELYTLLSPLLRRTSYAGLLFKLYSMFIIY